MKQNDKRIGKLKKKILLILYAGLALSLTKSPKKHLQILKQIPKEWGKINRQALNRAVGSLRTSRLVKEEYHEDGTMTLILSENGKREALRFNIDKMKIKKPRQWDKKWRVVMFDVPERLKKLRNSLRFHFRQLGLVELQKSVLVCPYPCNKEVEFIVEFYDARKYVRFILADKIDNEQHLINRFNLS